jgi:hypothetical protein
MLATVKALEQWQRAEEEDTNEDGNNNANNDNKNDNKIN